MHTDCHNAGNVCITDITYMRIIVFSHDVTTAMLVSQDKEMAVRLVAQTKPLGIELYFYANTFFCFSKPIWPVDT